MTAPPRQALRRHGSASRGELGLILGDGDASLLDVVDNALSKGVVLTGDLTLGLAHVDLVYARLSLLLCALDRIRPGEPEEPLERRARRRRARARARRARGRG
jgi:hypothetical protein